MAEPTALEQHMLELVNAERATAGVQPLAWDVRLNDSADAHNQWMIDADVFSHTGAGGSAPTDRMVAAGYQLTGSWTTGENLAWESLRGAPGLNDEVVDLHIGLMNSPGHRANILNGAFREVGIGFTTGEYQGWQGAFATQNFAKTGTAYFITGVAFDDRDGDLAYDPGEGLGGLTVTATSGGATLSATTYGSGGYEIALNPGTWTVTFSGGGFATSARTVTVGSANVKVDLVDPASASSGAPTAGNDVLQATPNQTEWHGGEGDDTITGSTAQDLLRGDEGSDRLAGGDSFDDLHGNMGDDTVAGGNGDDWVVGGKDQDVLFGDAGADIVYGNLGNDTCEGGAGDDVVRGGQNEDILRGGDGDDWLSGDRGSDTVTGGAGADTFHSFADAGLDRVTDFSFAAGDRVQLDPGTTWSVAQVGADTVITLSAGQVVLVGVSMSTLGAGWIFGA